MRTTCRVFALLLASACAGSSANHVEDDLQRRICRLRAEQTAQEVQLIEIQQEIIQARAELAEAQLRAEAHRCEAQRAHLEARSEVLFADCVKTHAQYQACVAETEKDSTQSTAWGCAGGFLASLLTMGAALPLAAAGCAVGAAVGPDALETCGPPPMCVLDRLSYQADVLREAGLQIFPECGDEDAQASL